MSVRTRYVERDCQFVVTVSCKDISSIAGIDAVFKDLDVAVTKIREDIGAPEHWYFLIDISADGVRRSMGEFDPYEPGCRLAARNPWKVFCPPFWTNAAANPQFRERLTKWLDRVEETLRLPAVHDLPTDGLWEHDDTQFGEPVATHLSLVDVAFVPSYTRLLRLWDLSHEVHQGGAVVEIVNRHGITPETKELIVCYTEVTGSDELGLLDLLDG